TRACTLSAWAPINAKMKHSVGFRRPSARVSGASQSHDSVSGQITPRTRESLSFALQPHGQKRAHKDRQRFGKVWGFSAEPATKYVYEILPFCWNFLHFLSCDLIKRALLTS